MRFILKNGCSSGREKIHEWSQGMVMVGLTGVSMLSPVQAIPRICKKLLSILLELKLCKGNCNDIRHCPSDLIRTPDPGKGEEGKSGRNRDWRG